MIEAMSKRMVAYIDRHNDRKHVSAGVMLFALKSLLTNVLTIFFSLCIGYWTGKFAETSLVLAAMAILRNLAGGAHSSSPTLCIVVSTAVVTVIPFIPIEGALIWVLTILSTILLILYAPADLKGKTRISDQGLKIMKIASVLLVGSNLFIQSGLLSLSYFIVSLLLIPWKGGKQVHA